MFARTDDFLRERESVVLEWFRDLRRVSSALLPQSTRAKKKKAIIKAGWLMKQLIAVLAVPKPTQKPPVSRVERSGLSGIC